MLSRGEAGPTRPVLVVGAGVAGSALALILAQRGIASVLVDRDAAHPTAPAEVLLPSARRRVEALGITLDELEPEARHDGLFVRASSGEARRVPFVDRHGHPSAAYVVSCARLVRILRDRGKAAGVDLRVGVEARELCDEAGRVRGARLTYEGGRVEELESGIVVIAAGAGKDVGHDLPSPGSVLVREYDCGGASPLDCELEPMPGGLGMIWSYGTAPGRFVVGVAVPGLVLGGPGTALDDALALAYERRTGRVEEARGGARGQAFGRRMPRAYDPNDAARAGLLFIGDALGNAVPFAVDGIGSALESATLAARSLETAEPPEVAYERSVRASYGRQLPRECGPLDGTSPWWRLLDTCLGAPTPLARALAGQLRRDETTADDEALIAQTLAVARHARVAPSILQRVRDLKIDRIYGEFPLLGKVCERLGADPSEPMRAACIFASCRGHVTDRHLQAAAGLELMYLGLRFHDGVVESDRTTDHEACAKRNAFVVAAGDLLKAEAYRIFASFGRRAIGLAGRAVEASARGRIRASQGAADPGLEPYLAVCRDAVGEIYAFAVGLGCDVDGQSDGDITRLARIGAKLGELVALADAVDDLHHFDLRRPLVSFLDDASLPHLAAVQTRARQSMGDEGASLAAAARAGNGAAASTLVGRLSGSGEMADEVRAVVRERLAELERDAGEIGPAADPFVALAREASLRASARGAEMPPTSA